MNEPTGQEHLTPVRITSTSATERGAFRKCRRQWFLTVVHRLDPQEGNVHLFLGKIYHSGLEAYYRAQKDGASLDDREVAALDAYQDAFTDQMAVIEGQLGFIAKFALPAFRDIGELGFEMLQNYITQERADPLLAVSRNQSANTIDQAVPVAEEIERHHRDQEQVDQPGDDGLSAAGNRPQHTQQGRAGFFPVGLGGCGDTLRVDLQ